MIRTKGKTQVLILSWDDHPEKTQDWYDSERQRAVEEGMLHKFAQEIDRDYSGAVQGVIVPQLWAQACVDAHIKLGVEVTGQACAGLDVADENIGTVGDVNALAIRKGPLLNYLEQWGDRDTGLTTLHAVHACREVGPVSLQYDAVGVGAGVKGEANRMQRNGTLPKNITMIPWFAGGQVLWPERHVVQYPDGSDDKNSPMNKDYYQNLKAQGWWMLRRRAEKTWRALNDPNFIGWKPDELLFIDGKMPLKHALLKQISQPVMIMSQSMKLMIDKTPEGTRSPNLADAVMMCFHPAKQGMLLKINATTLAHSKMPGRRALRRRYG